MGQSLPPAEFLMAEPTSGQAIQGVLCTTEYEGLRIHMLMCSASMYFESSLCRVKTFTERARPLIAVSRVRVRLHDFPGQPVIQMGLPAGVIHPVNGVELGLLSSA